MEFELSFELNLENTFCESSFLVVRTGKRRSIPSIKRLDIQLSKIKTTLNRKVSLNKHKLALNLQSARINPSFNSLFQSNDNLTRQTIFRKNSLKKTTSSNLNKRITKYTNTSECVKNKTELNLLNRPIHRSENKKVINRPRMGVASLKKNSLNQEVTRPSVVPLPFLDLKPDSSLSRVSLCTVKKIKRSKNLQFY